MIRSLFVGIYNANKQLCKQQLLYASKFIQDENSKMKYWENTANKYIEGKHLLKLLKLTNICIICPTGVLLRF